MTSGMKKSVILRNLNLETISDELLTMADRSYSLENTGKVQVRGVQDQNGNGIAYFSLSIIYFLNSKSIESEKFLSLV